MKKIILFTFIALATISLSSCNKNTKTEENSDKTAQNAQENGVISTPIALSTADFKVKVIDYEANPNVWNYLGDKPAIIDFWASWCAPCRAVAPVLEELAKEYAGQIYVYKVDVDKEQALAAAFGIQSIPTLVFVPMKGDPKAEMGAIPKEAFKKHIDEFLLPSISQ